MGSGGFGVLGVWRGVACGECEGRKRWGTRTGVLEVEKRCLSVVVLAVLGLALERFCWGNIGVRVNSTCGYVAQPGGERTAKKTPRVRAMPCPEERQVLAKGSEIWKTARRFAERQAEQ